MRIIALLILTLVACSSTPEEPADVDSGSVDAARDAAGDAQNAPDALATDASEAGPTCDDPDDLGGEDSPVKLPEITDKDATPPHRLRGVMAGVSDVDAFTFLGTDSNFGVIDFRASTSGSNMEVCAFVKCVKGTTARGACSQGAAATSALGEAGCCDTNAVAFSWNCKGFTQVDDSANVTIRIKASAPICTPYNVDYNL